MLQILQHKIQLKFKTQLSIYKAIGNPLTYRDSLSFTWKNGRQLASLQNGNSVVDYTYNADGVRIGKSGAKTAAYTVCGTQILSENN